MKKGFMSKTQAMAYVMALSATLQAAPSGNQNLSNYTGNGAIEYYSGNNNTLEFNGGDNASLLNAGDAAEPFILQVVNAHATLTRSFYISLGLLYTRGSETAGQLKTGAFQGIEDTGTTTSLTASTDNAVTIEQFIAYCRKYPTFVPLIQATSTSATAQLAVSMQYYRQGMIKNESPTTIPLRKYANGMQYQLQFQDLKEPLFFSEEDIVIVKVAANSTLTLNVYPLVSKNSRTALTNDIVLAKAVADSNPAAVQAAAQAKSFAPSLRSRSANAIAGIGRV